MEKQVDNKLASSFLDVLVNNNPLNLQLTSIFRKKTFTRLITNYFSFTSFSYKMGLVVELWWTGLTRSTILGWAFIRI